jgi:hypothetical protein
MLAERSERLGLDVRDQRVYVFDRFEQVLDLHIGVLVRLPGTLM